MSKYTLIRQFEEVYKTSPIHYLKQVRIIQSLSLLWEEETIGQVAKKVGFSTGNYFSKVFKKEMGMSPSEYRNQKEIYLPR
ncbi:helix-turn-helix domain-containing protein [Enterococcus crotali]|uniref:helix-turn-helix domain-containing protein n=1 Tax=Enterococcus crotali TaxID=1453587 RepID=UPI001EF9F7D8|nr:helix-turn-helix domain-containing protein [Enterococcus crotali]